MPNAVKKLKQEEKKVVLAYAQLKLKANRLSKELDTMKRKRKKFETANFKIAHNDLYNKFTTDIEYSEYKAIGDNNAQ
jgi:hypothetical protein